MKLLRVGEKGSEIVAALDKNQKLRDLSSKIRDLNPETLNFKVLQNLEDTVLEDLKEINPSIRVGSCVSRPIDFLAIGLNYKAHAEGTKSKLPTEPILFNKSSGCIQGPNDPIIKPKERSGVLRLTVIVSLGSNRVQFLMEDTLQTITSF